MVSDLFRQLFRQRPRGCLRNLGCAAAAAAASRGQQQQTRTYAARPRASRDRGMKTNESRWQQRSNLMPEDRTAEFAQYPQLSAAELATRTERPRRCKMLLRDFVDGILFSFSYPLASLP